MEFGLKGTSRLVADVTGSRHSGLGFTVFWLFTADLQLQRFTISEVTANWHELMIPRRIMRPSRKDSSYGTPIHEQSMNEVFRAY